MSNNVPEIKIGTTMSELKNLVSQQTNLSEAQKNSIFNFIKDEEQCGDGLISNEIELTLLQSWFKPNKNKENTALVKMPDNIQAEEDNVKVHSREVQLGDGNVGYNVTLEKQIDENNKLEDRIIKKVADDDEVYVDREYVSNMNNSDAQVIERLTDYDNDSIADTRHKSVFYPDGTSMHYYDGDLDGQFDTKSVYKQGGVASYERSEEGKWKL